MKRIPKACVTIIVCDVFFLLFLLILLPFPFSKAIPEFTAITIGIALALLTILSFVVKDDEDFKGQNGIRLIIRIIYALSLGLASVGVAYFIFF